MLNTLPETYTDVPYPIPVGSKTVMLVDDEPVVRSIIRRILEERGYFLLEAANGSEGIFLAHQFSYPIDLLITDVSMPRMSGIELAQRVAAMHPETHVLFLSGYCDGAMPDNDPLDKDASFLQKPFRADALLRKVSEVLARVG